MERKEKKEYISEYIDLGNGRFSDDEIEKLYDLVENRDSYDGCSNRSVKYDEGVLSSDGRFKTTETITYTFMYDGRRIWIRETIHFVAEGEDPTEYSIDHETGREILRVIKNLF